MSWYRKMVVAALLDGQEMEMFERWIDAISTGISNSKNKIKMNRMDPAVAKLDAWFFKIIQCAKKIWEHFRAGRLQDAISCGDQIEQAVPQMAKYFDTSDITQQLEMVTDTMKSVQVSQQKKQNQQRQWSQGNPPPQPQMRDTRPQIPQSVPSATPAAVG